MLLRYLAILSRPPNESGPVPLQWRVEQQPGGFSESHVPLQPRGRMRITSGKKSMKNMGSRRNNLFFWNWFKQILGKRIRNCRGFNSQCHNIFCINLRVFLQVLTKN